MSEKNNIENVVVTEETSIKPTKKKNKLFETVETVFIALLLAVFIRATVAEARYIPSESMLPNLLIKDRLVVEKISGYMSKPQRGDILVFYPPANMNEEDDKTLNKALIWLGFTSKNAYIKRVVGLPGETIEVKNGSVFINGKILDEPYIKEKPNYPLDPIKLGENELFMCGDNRNNSMDSHIWGPLPMKYVIGKAVVRFWPINRIGLVN